MFALLMLLAGAAAVPGDQAVERQHVLTIEAQEIDNGILSEITWDSGALLLQGVVANPDGSLSARYVVIPAKATKLEKRQDQTGPSLDYWNRKSKRVSPTGLGTISTAADSKMPLYGVASLERRMLDAQDMAAKRLADGEAVGRGNDQVEQHHVGVMDRGVLERLRSRRRGDHVVALVFEPHANKANQLIRVVDHEDPGSRRLGTPRRSRRQVHHPDPIAGLTLEERAGVFMTGRVCRIAAAWTNHGHKGSLCRQSVH